MNFEFHDCFTWIRNCKDNYAKYTIILGSKVQKSEAKRPKRFKRRECKGRYQVGLDYREQTLTWLILFLFSQQQTSRTAQLMVYQGYLLAESLLVQFQLSACSCLLVVPVAPMLGLLLTLVAEIQVQTEHTEQSRLQTGRET